LHIFLVIFFFLYFGCRFSFSPTLYISLITLYITFKFIFSSLKNNKTIKREIEERDKELEERCRELVKGENSLSSYQGREFTLIICSFYFEFVMGFVHTSIVGKL
jgi:Ca2+/Na+ antiporter